MTTVPKWSITMLPLLHNDPLNRYISAKSNIWIQKDLKINSFLSLSSFLCKNIFLSHIETICSCFFSVAILFWMLLIGIETKHHRTGSVDDNYNFVPRLARQKRAFLKTSRLLANLWIIIKNYQVRPSSDKTWIEFCICLWGVSGSQASYYATWIHGARLWVFYIYERRRWKKLLVMMMMIICLRRYWSWIQETRLWEHIFSRVNNIISISFVPT